MLLDWRITVSSQQFNVRKKPKLHQEEYWYFCKIQLLIALNSLAIINHLLQRLLTFGSTMKSQFRHWKRQVVNKITNFETGLYKDILHISCLIHSDTNAFLLKYHKVWVHMTMPIAKKDLWQLYYLLKKNWTLLTFFIYSRSANSSALRMQSAIYLCFLCWPYPVLYEANY